MVPLSTRMQARKTVVARWPGQQSIRRARSIDIGRLQAPNSL